MADIMPICASPRRGDWIQTYTGRAFWPLDPCADDIDIVDIAHALSMKCRYSGHTKRFYSVAEHSVLVSRHVPIKHALWGLMHDAAEAYSADIPRPIKPFLVGWSMIEARIMDAVCDRFGMYPVEPPEVKAIDLAITSDERAALLNPSLEKWQDGGWNALPPAIGTSIECWGPWQGESAFLRRFNELVTPSTYDLEARA
jgi:hypothetical protein